jgi:hypothetical protein
MCQYNNKRGIRGGVVCWDTVLQAGRRSQVRFPLGSLELFIDNPSGRSVALGLTQPVTEMYTRVFPEGKGGRSIGLTTLPPSCADCLEILGASTSWNPKGLSRPVMGYVYLFTTIRGILYNRLERLELVLGSLIRKNWQRSQRERWNCVKFFKRIRNKIKVLIDGGGDDDEL